MRSRILVMVALGMFACHTEPVPPRRGEFAAVSAGTFRTCAVKTDGTLWCWGNGALTRWDSGFGAVVAPTPQLPPGVTDAPAQVSVLGDGPFTAVSVGLFEICALADQGRLHCFAPGVTGDVGYPEDLGQVWASVRVGDSSSCGLALDHSATCWGLDERFHDEAVDVFVYDQPLGGGWAAVAAGAHRNCGIKAAGGVWCWNADGRDAPALAAGGDWLALGIGMGDTVFAIDGDHRLWSVGVGPIGDAADWADLEVGASHACATKLDGSLRCWGNADLGRLGIEPAVSSSAPTQPLAGTWASVSAGGAHTCGVQTDSTLWCWGSDGTMGGDQQQPVQIAIGQVAGVSVGGCHTCATRADGTLSCWGCGDRGQIDTSRLSAQSPRAITGAAWSSIAVGEAMTCGIKTDGTLWCWGASFDFHFQPAAVVPPTQIAGTGWSAVSVAFHDACATRTDHTLWCWGEGVLGDGTLTDPATTTPVQVPGAKWASVSVAGNRDEFGFDGSDAHTCATTTDGELWCWGLVTFPSGTATVSTMPVQVEGVWSSVSAGYDRCAIKTDGTLWCGAGFAVQVPGTGWTSVSVSMSHIRLDGAFVVAFNQDQDFVCALKADHSLWCWRGPIFTGNVAAPVAVPGTWSTVASGDASCATQLDGSLWCWGPNGFGQLANAAAWKPTPAQMKF